MATGVPGLYSLWEAAVNERVTCYALICLLQGTGISLVFETKSVTGYREQFAYDEKYFTAATAVQQSYCGDMPLSS
jgi:hypothetical protein